MPMDFGIRRNDGNESPNVHSRSVVMPAQAGINGNT